MLNTYTLKTIVKHPFFRTTLIAAIVGLLLVSCESTASSNENEPTPTTVDNPTVEEPATTAEDNSTVSEENTEDSPTETPTPAPATEDTNEEEGGRTNSNEAPNAPNPNDFTERDLRYEDKAIKITHHARCRMDCRYIDAYEIQEVIDQGNINHRKSQSNPAPGKCPTIAYEGVTKDDQTVRVILGDCDNRPIIITVIDLKNEYNCTCK